MERRQAGLLFGELPGPGDFRQQDFAFKPDGSWRPKPVSLGPKLARVPSLPRGDLPVLEQQGFHFKHDGSWRPLPVSAGRRPKVMPSLAGGDASVQERQALAFKPDGTWRPGGCGCGGCGCGSNGNCAGACGNCACKGSTARDSTLGQRRLGDSNPKMPTQLTGGKRESMVDSWNEGGEDSPGTGATARLGGPTTGTPSWCSGFTCNVRGVAITGQRHPSRNAVCHSWHCELCEDCDAPPVQPPDSQGCPDPCLEAARQVEMCVAALASASNDRVFNMMQSACRQMADWYNMICGGIPVCPAVTVPPPRKLCGGDVTQKMLDAMKEAARKCGAGRSQALQDYKKRFTSDLNWKVNPPADADCNQGCPDTLCICSKCMNDSVPANIMYGFVTAACDVPLIVVNQIAFDLALRTKGARDPRGRSDISRDEAHRQYSEIWPPHDQKAVQLGYMLGTNGTTDKDTFCAIFGLMASDLQGPDDPDCKRAACCS